MATRTGQIRAQTSAQQGGARGVAPARCPRALALVTLLALVLAPGMALSGDGSGLEDLEGRGVSPFRDGATATVLLFTRTDCPISNRYAPEVRRIVELYRPRQVDFWLVYADPDEKPSAISEHVASYDLPVTPLRDPHHTWVRRVEARITPEVAVFDSMGALVYRGRIDDRFVDFGKTRAAATRHDLIQALESVLAGRPVEVARTEAVGCYIAPLR